MSRKGTNKRAKYKRKTKVFLFISEREYFRRKSKVRKKRKVKKYNLSTNIWSTEKIFLLCGVEKVPPHSDKNFQRIVFLHF